MRRLLLIALALFISACAPAADGHFDRGVAYFSKGEYDKAWEDIHKAQSLGCQVDPGFLKKLREASGRQR